MSMFTIHLPSLSKQKPLSTVDSPHKILSAPLPVVLTSFADDTQLYSKVGNTYHHLRQTDSSDFRNVTSIFNASMQ